MRLAAQYGSAAAAIVQRDFRIYMSYKLRFLTQVAGSLFSIVIFYYVSRMVQVDGFTPDTYFAFVVVGLFIFAILTSTFGCAAVLRQELVAGTSERLATSAFGPVASAFSVMAFPVLMSLVNGTLVVAVAAVTFGLPLEWSTAPLAVPVALLGALAFMPFGVFIAAAVLVAKQAMGAGNFLLAGISIIAGLYFPVTLLPGWIEWMSYVQPFTPAVDLMRHLLVGALDRAGFDVVWSNQWEPATRAQHAHDCYVRHVESGDFQAYGRELRGITSSATDLGLTGHVASNEDIAVVLDRYEAQLSGSKRPVFPVVPDVDVLVGGFPCQDYSVAKTLRQSHGLVGKKGVLWWEIHRLLRLKLEQKRPIRYLFLENVDRLIKSPTGQRGRDFAVMLASLADLGYEVEWRVVNAAEYGFPQKRRRVFIIGRLGRSQGSPHDQLTKTGVLARALPLLEKESFDWTPVTLDRDVKLVSDTFNLGPRKTPFGNAGVMRISGGARGAAVWTTDVRSAFAGQRNVLGDILEPAEDVPAQFFVEGDDLVKWQFLKGAKSLTRISRSTGIEYTYDEGPIPFPDHTDGPSRTILTGEGGATASRFKHLIQTEDGRFRRLTPRELELLNGFPGDWTAGMSDGKRAFMMGNALVVGLVERIADSLIQEFESVAAPAEHAAAS